MGSWFTWVQLAVALGSLVAPVCAFADALRFTPQEYGAAATFSRVGRLATIACGFVFLIGVGGWRPGTPFGLPGIVWLLATTVVVVHFCEIHPRLVAARARHVPDSAFGR